MEQCCASVHIDCNDCPQLTYMASGQLDNTNDFLNELSFEKPDHIKLEIEKK